MHALLGADIQNSNQMNALNQNGEMPIDLAVEKICNIERSLVLLERNKEHTEKKSQNYSKKEQVTKAIEKSQKKKENIEDGLYSLITNNKLQQNKISLHHAILAGDVLKTNIIAGQISTFALNDTETRIDINHKVNSQIILESLSEEQKNNLQNNTKSSLASDQEFTPLKLACHIGHLPTIKLLFTSYIHKVTKGEVTALRNYTNELNDKSYNNEYYKELIKQYDLLIRKYDSNTNQNKLESNEKFTAEEIQEIRANLLSKQKELQQKKDTVNESKTDGKPQLINDEIDLYIPYQLAEKGVSSSYIFMCIFIKNILQHR